MNVPRRATRTLTLNGLVILAVVSIGLAGASMLQSRALQHEAAAAAAQASSPSPRIEPTTEPPQTSTHPSPTEAFEPQRLLVAGSESGHLIRASVGACPTPAGTVEVSFSNGESWESSSNSNQTAARILQLELELPDDTRMVALAAPNCTPTASRSRTGGSSWERASLTEAPWHLDPTKASTVQAPTGPVEISCDPVGLSASGERAIVLCRDSSVTYTTDSGSTWSAPLSVPFAAAVGLAPAQFLVATHGGTECTSIQLGVVAPTAVGPVSTCLDIPTEADQIAITATDDVVAVWAGDEFARSFDDGATWE